MQAYVSDYECCRKHLKFEESLHLQFEYTTKAGAVGIGAR